MGVMSSSGSVRPAPRAFWADVRFLLGVVLVVASVAGVWFVVSSARETTPVFAANATIVAGDAVTTDDLRVVEVALGASGEAYASPATLQPGAVAARTVEAGELVPNSALVAADAVTSTTIVLQSYGQVAGSIAKGSVVEVWHAPRNEQSEYDPPRILVASATVVSVVRDDAVVGDAEVSLELVVQRSDVPAVLEAIAASDRISMVPSEGASS